MHQKFILEESTPQQGNEIVFLRMNVGLINFRYQLEVIVRLRDAQDCARTTLCPNSIDTVRCETGTTQSLRQGTQSWALNQMSNMHEQFGLTEEEKGPKGVLTSVKSHEVNLLVSSPRQASGSSLWENIQDFESLSETIRSSRECEDAIFVHLVSAGVSYKTRPDEDDSFGQIISFCREYSKESHEQREKEMARYPLFSTDRYYDEIDYLEDCTRRDVDEDTIIIWDHSR